MSGWLADVLRAGRARFPAVRIDEAALAAYLDARLAATPDDDVAAELYLCCGALAGDGAALAALERDYLAGVPQLVTRIDASAAGAAEIQQRVRERLLVGTEPKLAEYHGHGRLGSWLRVVAVRTALNARAGEKPSVAPEDVDDALVAADDPELEYLRARYAPQFHGAFVAALEGLEPRARTVLRLALVDGLGIDPIAELYHVHRATAARWLESARVELFERTRERLRRDLHLSATEFESIVRLVKSQIDVSICRILREQTG